MRRTITSPTFTTTQPQLVQALEAQRVPLWRAADSALTRVLQVRHEHPFIAHGLIQATRCLMHAALLWELRRELGPDAGRWRRCHGVDEFVLACGVVLRVNKINEAGDRALNKTQRCRHYGTGYLFGHSGQGIRGYAMLGYVLDPLESEVASLRASWTNELNERIVMPIDRPDDPRPMTGMPIQPADDNAVEMKLKPRT